MIDLGTWPSTRRAKFKEYEAAFGMRRFEYHALGA